MNQDLTKGPIARTLLLFALPMTLRNMLQQLYNVADTLIVGRFLGPDALALVPCLAASRDGVRLGRGGGYYDRFLAGFAGRALLACPAALVFDTLPADPWDARFAPGDILTG